MGEHECNDISQDREMWRDMFNIIKCHRKNKVEIYSQMVPTPEFKWFNCSIFMLSFNDKRRYTQ